MRTLSRIAALALLAASTALAAPKAATPAMAPAASNAPAPVKHLHFIYLVRHGMYTSDTLQTDDRIGSPLNALGHEQARLVGAKLASLPVHFRTFVSSDFTRARQTADDIGEVLHRTPERDSLIHECTPTADLPDYMKNHTRDEIAWCDANLNAAWAKYMTPSPDQDTADLLVCHGNVIRWFVAKTLGGDPAHWSHMDIGNCSITILAVRPDGVTRLVMYSSVDHIPIDQQTWTGRGAGWK